MKAIIKIDVPDFQIGQEVNIHFKDSMVAKGVVALLQEHCEDAISRQAVLDLIEHYNSDGLGSVFYGYEEGVKFADAVNKLPSVSTEKTGRWIPVSERLPKEYDLVLVTEKYGFVDTAYFVHNDFTEMDEWIVADDETIDVIAWMPLPQPYDVESEVQDADSN